MATTNLLSNTGVLSLQGDTGALSLSAGSGIGISGLTISNTGVLSLQGDTGALSFTAGTGIGISGLTFTNTGIISASAGSGISVSGTNPLTIENTGVLSLQGDTGALSLGAGSGIGISGLTISNTGVLGVGGSTTSYLTGNIEFKSGSGISIAQSTTAITVGNTGVLSLQGDTGALSLTAGTGIGISGLTISNAGVTSLQGDTGALSLTAGTGIGISGLTITNDGVTSITAGSNITISGSTGDVTINSASPAYTGGNGITFSGTTIEMSGSYSGNMGISGQLTAQYIDANVNSDNPNGATPTMVLSIWGGGQGNAVSSSTSYYGLGISDSTLDFITNSNFAWWYNDTQIASMNSSGDMSVSGEISGGSYNLAGGTGISFSGVTITNTGVTSLGAGTGISLSGSTGGITVTNSGVTSLQGDTGALSLTANNGISISGLGIGMSGSYSGNLVINNNSNVQIGQTISNFSSIIHWGDNSSLYGGGLVENYNGIQFLLANKSGSSYNGLNSNSYTIPFYIGVNGEAYTGNNLQETIGSNNNVSVRNTLDDGSGNMSIAGTLTAQYINANVNNDNPNGATPTVVLSIYGGNAGGAHAGRYGLGISNITLDFLAPSGANFAWWASTSQIASMNGSGDFSVNGSISTGAMPSFSNGIRETGYGSLRVGGYFAGIEMWQGSGHDNVRAFNAENYNAWSVGFFNESSGAFDGINSGDYSIAFAVYPNGEVVTGNAQSQGVNSNNFISVRNTLDDGSGNMSIAGYLIAHPTMGSNVVSGTLWNLSAASANVTFGSSNTGTVTLYIETIRATTTGKYYVQTHNTTANTYPSFWATYLEANVTYYVGQTFVIGIPGGDTIENWYAGGNAGGTLTVTGILNLG